MELRAEGVSRRFFRKTGQANYFYAVPETDFRLPEGSLTEITGRSGSGKSTLLNLLGGLLQPSGGRVLAGETDLYALSDEERSAFRNRHIGVIPQGRTALRSLTVLENVLLPSRLYVQKSENVLEYRDRALALLEKLSIGHLKDAWPNELSGGELRRLSIARALIMSPDILLADEPTGDLDDENTGSVLKLLREKADGGTAVLLVTHEQSAAAYADRVLTMQEGRLSGG